MISDMDKYLEEPVFLHCCDYKILNWRKVHTPRYPILSMMAIDFMGTPMSTVAPEPAFNVGGRVLEECQSSLNPDTQRGFGVHTRLVAVGIKRPIHCQAILLHQFLQPDQFLLSRVKFPMV